MVTYLRVVKDASQMVLKNPRSAFEGGIGIPWKAVRERLTGLLLIKEKQARLEEESKKVNEKMEVERGQVQRIDKEIELVAKRGQVLKKKEKEVGGLEAEVDGINEGLNEVRCRFDELAAADLCVSEQQTSPL